MKKRISEMFLSTSSAICGCAGFMWGEHGWSNGVLVLLMVGLLIIVLTGIIFKPWNFK